MGYFTASGIQFAPLPEGVTPTALFTGTYHDTGAYGPSPMASRPIFDDQAKTFTNVDGVVDVRHGFRGRMLYATLVFAGSLAYADATCKSTLDSLAANARYTIQMPGGSSYDGCKLKECGQGTWVNMSGGVLFVLPCIFIQKSTTN